MIRTITAEFQSIDEAELAARRIKDKVEGISRITINSKNKKANNTNSIGNIGFSNMNVAGGFSTYNAVSSSVYTPLIFNNVGEHTGENHFNELSISKSVTIEIHCKNDDVKIVSSILTALGGLNIKNN